MLGKRRTAWALRLLLADGATLFASFIVAYKLRVLLNQPLGRDAAPLRHYLWLLQLIVPVWVAAMALLGGYGVAWTARSRTWLIARVSGVGFILLMASLFLIKESEVNRSVLVLFTSV